MDGFNRFYNTLKSSTALPQQISPGDTIRKLTETLGNAPQVEDRKAALLGLKGLSRDWKADVGQAAVPLLLTVLETDAQEDVDMGKTVLETLNVLCEVEEKTTKSSRETPAGIRNTDRVLSTEKPFTALLSLLSQNHFHIRYFGIQFLSTLLSNRSDVIQKYILAAPGGVGRMVEFLDDPRELIRNESLLLLRSLSSSNTDIQKLIAFEGVFERLFEIIHKEGGVAAGNIIVQDCLTAMVSLLWFNVSNQNFFREASCISQIAPLLLFPPANQLDDHSLGQFSIQFWPEQKVANVEVVLTLLRMLVSGDGDSRKTNQKSLLNSSVTRCLIELSLASNAPTTIKSNSLLALADIMRDSPPNQELFKQLLISPLIPSSYDAEEYSADNSDIHWERAEPVPAILALVAMAIEGDPGLGLNATQPIGLRARAAAVALFENYVANLPDVKVSILSSMTTQSPSNKPSPQTSGTVLLNGLRSFPSSSSAHFDSHASFFSCILLSHLLRSTESCKRIAREITISSSQNDDPSSGKSTDEQNLDDNDDLDRLSLVGNVIGNLMFAQNEYGTPAGQTMSDEWTRVMVGYLILLSIWMWESPKTVKEFLSEGTNLEVLVRPILQVNGVDVLVQGLCAFLLGIVYEYNREQTSISREKLHHFLRTRIGTDQFVSRIHRLREDPRFRNVTPDVLELFDDKDDNETLLEYGVWFDWSFVEFLKNSYLAAQRSILLEPGAPENSRLSMDDSETAELVASLRSSLANATQQQESLKQNMQNEVNEKQKLSDELVALTGKLSTMESEYQEKQNSQMQETQNLRQELEQLQTNHTQLNNSLNESKSQLEKDLEAAREEVQTLMTLKQKLETEITELKSSGSSDATKVTEELTKLKIDYKELQTKESDTQKEQEDLLVLLEEISNKRKADKERMRAANIEVSDDEEEDNDE